MPNTDMMPLRMRADTFCFAVASDINAKRTNIRERDEKLYIFARDILLVICFKTKTMLIVQYFS